MAFIPYSPISRLQGLAYQLHQAARPDMSALKDHPELMEASPPDGSVEQTPAAVSLNPPAGLSDAAKAFFLQLQMMGVMDDFEIGSGKDDVLIGGANTLIDAKDGNDTITVWKNSTVIAGAGDDTVNAWSGAHVEAGEGNDYVNVAHDSFVDGGDGNDILIGTSNAVIHGGDGDDQIVAQHDANLSGGDGNDLLVARSNSVVEGGEGDDQISASWNSYLSGGAGDDVIVVDGDSVVDGGDGNDTIGSRWNATIHGGRGDDVLSAGRNSTISGGTGNDTISVSHDSTILFDVGDGKDTIWAGGASNTTITLGAGFSAENTTITYPTDADFPKYSVIVSFNDGSDQLTITNVTPSTELTLAFADGSSETIALPEEHKAQYGEILRAKMLAYIKSPQLGANQVGERIWIPPCPHVALNA